MGLPKRNYLLGAGGAAFLVFLLLSLRQKPPLGPERAADAIVSKGQRAIEAGDIDEAMELVADDFQGQVRGLGNVTKDELKSFLTRASLLGGINITVARQELAVSQDERTVDITLYAVVVAGGMRRALENNTAREIGITIELRDNEWLVVSAQ